MAVEWNDRSMLGSNLVEIGLILTQVMRRDQLWIANYVHCCL
jgi:hypothetical protein